MPVRTAFAKPQFEIGVAIEVTRGTPLAPAFWLPIKTPKYKPNLTFIEDDTLQGSMVKTYDLVPSLRHDSHGWDSYPYLDSFPVLLRTLLGSADTLTTKPANTTLAAVGTVGAAFISTAATIAAGSWITIGSGVTQETHKTISVSGAGPYTVTLSAAGVGYPLLFAQANGATVAGLTGHTFSLLNNAGSGNQPPSATLTEFDGEEWRQLPAAQLDKLTIKGTANGLIDYTCSWLSNPSITPTPPTPSFSSAQAPPGWTAQLTIGTTQVQYFMDWEIDLVRGVKPIPAITGTQAYFLLFASELVPTGKLTVIEQTGAPELAAFLAGTQQVFDLTLADVKSGFALQIHSTKAQFKTGERDLGKEWVEAKLDIDFLPTATDATAGGVSPIQATVANSQVTAF